MEKKYLCNDIILYLFFKKYKTFGGICRKGMKLHYTNVDHDFEFNNGEQKFLIDEMEVFKIRP